MMRTLEGELILSAWERCREQSGPASAVTLLALALPDRPWEDIAALPLAERNALLLELRASTFGPLMEGFAVCPECGTQLEFALDARSLQQSLKEQPLSLNEAQYPSPMRPVNSLDLMAALTAVDEMEAQAILLARTLGLQPSDLTPWPQDADAQFEAANASAEMRVQLQCPLCTAKPLLDLDLERFLRREVTTAAHRLLSDTHALATAYGWSEASILAMSAGRRAAYLEMLAP